MKYLWKTIRREFQRYIALACFNIASTKVVFPWSTWAIIAIFLISLLLINRLFFSVAKKHQSIKYCTKQHALNPKFQKITYSRLKSKQNRFKIKLDNHEVTKQAPNYIEYSQIRRETKIRLELISERRKII